MSAVHAPHVEAELGPIPLALTATAATLLALLVLYLVGFDQGAVSRTGMFLHELMHDGRHLMGVPCH